MRRRYTMKQLPPELRPRERLLAEGPEALTAVLIRIDPEANSQREQTSPPHLLA
jgi:hypothetical protein